MENKTIEILKDEKGKILEIKGIPCLTCESIDTHLYKDYFVCFSCKNKIKNQNEYHNYK